MWGVVSEVTGLSLTLSQWLSSGLEVKKYNPVNVFYTAVVWALWKSFVFRVSAGKEGMRRVMVNCVKLLRNWGLVNNSEDEGQLVIWACALEARSVRLERMAWTPPDDDERS
jgi:hypothetical protein